MKRVKKKKSPMTQEQKIKHLEAKVEWYEERRAEEIALMAKTIFAIELLDLHEILGWREKRISERLFSQLVLFEELADGRATPVEMIKNCKDFTGVDVYKLIDDLSNGEPVTQQMICEMIREQKKQEK